MFRFRSAMICREGSVSISRGSAPVYLNVYDLNSMNGYTYWLGLGAYHSGVEVKGVEYAYGGHDQATSGVFLSVPKQFEGCTFRESVLVGWTELSDGDVRRMMKELGRAYRGNAYNLITRNCNHFCNEACVRLTGNPIPNWVNRLAKIGFYFKCIIPEERFSSNLAQQKTEVDHVEESTKKTESLSLNGS